MGSCDNVWLATCLCDEPVHCETWEVVSAAERRRSSFMMCRLHFLCMYEGQLFFSTSVGKRVGSVYACECVGVCVCVGECVCTCLSPLLCRGSWHKLIYTKLTALAVLCTWVENEKNNECMCVLFFVNGSQEQQDEQHVGVCVCVVCMWCACVKN